MARRKNKGRPVNAIVVVDKPTGRSSNHVLQQVKRLFNARKAGHTGALDPLATGVLPICLGEATKVSSYLLDADKSYRVTCQLGTVTDSGDVDGEVIKQCAIPDFSEQDLAEIIDQFKGEQQQVPPMFSALKHQGQPLYKLARQGIEVERKARLITIYDIRIVEVTPTSFTLDVSCSKGTYIRTLVEDISHRLGTGGHVVMLRRTTAAGYTIDNAVNMDVLEQKAIAGFHVLDTLLLPTENALPDWPKYIANEQQVTALRHGQRIESNINFRSKSVRIFDEQQQFIGLAEMSELGTISPKRIFVLETA